jgi:hypothetical protein
MLGGATTYAAELLDERTYENFWSDAESINQHLVANGEKGFFDTIPDCIIVTEEDFELGKMVRQLMRDSRTANKDWDRELSALRKFGTDFFARADEQIAKAFEVHNTGAAPSEPESTARGVTEDRLEEWWGIVDAAEFKADALRTMMSMWEGAPTLLSDEMKARIVAPWETVRRFLDDYGLILSNPGRTEDQDDDLS